MSEDAAPSRLEEALAQTVVQLRKETGCSKRTAVRMALISAIQSDLLRPGELVPSERRLAEVLNVSLGTVQVALDQLRQFGHIVRRRGDGTRIAQNSELLRNKWHFRLTDRDSGAAVAAASADVEIDEVFDQGDWSAFLGSGGFVRVRRRMMMQNTHRVGADMFLPSAIARPLLKVKPVDLAMVNLRTIFPSSLGIHPIHAETDIAVDTLPPATAKTFNLPIGNAHFIISAKIFGEGDAPLYFQRIYASCRHFNLLF